MLIFDFSKLDKEFIGPNQSGQFHTVLTETLEIFRSGTPPDTRNTTEMYLLIFLDVLGVFRDVSGNEQFNFYVFFFRRKFYVNVF